MELPKGGGGGCAIRQCLCMFRKGRPLSLWLHFGLHFGVIFGAKFATILLFGRPGGQNRLTKERLNKSLNNKKRPYGSCRAPYKQLNRQTIRLSNCHYSTGPQKHSTSCLVPRARWRIFNKNILVCVNKNL